MMFDESDAEDTAPAKEELFKPVNTLKGAKKPAAKKAPGEKKPKAPSKKKAEKKGLLAFYKCYLMGIYIINKEKLTLVEIQLYSYFACLVSCISRALD